MFAINITEKTKITLLHTLRGSLYIGICFLLINPLLQLTSRIEPVFVLLIIAFIPLVLMIGFRSPSWICITLIMFLYFRLHDAIIILNPVGIPKALTYLTLIFTGFHLLMGRIKLYWSRELTLLILFAAFVYISAPMAVYTSVSLGYAKFFRHVCLLIIITVMLLRHRADLNLTLRFTIVSGLILSSIVLYKKSQLGPVDRMALSGKVGSLLGDPNDLAATLLFPLSVCLVFAFYQSKSLFNKVVSYITIPMILMVIASTKSRGGMLAALIAFLFTCYKKLNSKILFTSISLISVAAILMFSGIDQRLQTIATTGSLDLSAMERIYAWRAAFAMALNNPIFGVGAGNFSNHYFQYTPVWTGQNLAAHSTWFGMLGETGFIGFTLYITLIIFSLKKIYNCLQHLANPNCPLHNDNSITLFARSTFLGFISMLIATTFLSYQYSWHIYLFIAFIVVTERIIKQSCHHLSNQHKHIEGKYDAQP